MILDDIGIRQLTGIAQYVLTRPTRYPALLRQLSLLWRQPTTDTAPMPVTAMIEPITRCNLQCPECPVGRGELGRNGEMSLDAFAELWKMFRGKIVHVLLFNQGEPLLARQFDEMAKVCAETKTYSVTATNGTLLNKDDWAARLVQSELSEIIVSIDGTTQESFEKYRIGGKLDIVVAGVKLLRVARDAVHKRSPIITMQMLLSRINEHEWDSAPAFAKQIGCDGLVFKTMQIERLHDPAARAFLPSDRRLWRYHETADGALVLRRKWNGCRRLWWHPVIYADGELVPCCFDKSAEYSYGNVFCDGFESVWNNNNARLFRSQFIRCTAPPLPMCRNCTEGLWKVEMSPRELARVRRKSIRERRWSE